VRNLILSLLVVSIGLPALAASKKKMTPPPPAPDVVVPIQESNIDLDHLSMPKSNRAMLRLEMNASSWSPNGLSAQSNLSNTSGFGAGGAPRFSLNAGSQGWTLGSGDLYPLIGMSYSTVSRSGTIRLSGGTTTSDQDANLLTARVGVEYMLTKGMFHKYQPFIGMAYTPSWMSIPKSEFGDGGQGRYDSWEQTLGVTAWVSAVWGVELGIENESRLGSNGLSGQGATAGLRWVL